MTNVEEVRVGSDEAAGLRTSDLGGDTVRQAHSASDAVVPTSPKPSRRHPDRRINFHAVEQPELGYVKDGVLLLDAGDTYEVVKHFRDSQRSERGIASGEEPSHL